MYKQSKDRCAACEHSDNVIEGLDYQVESDAKTIKGLKGDVEAWRDEYNKCYNREEDLIIKIAESIPISAIEALMINKNVLARVVGAPQSSIVIKGDDLRKLIKEAKG